MKEKAKRIFALSGVFICILVLLSNIIFTVANASSNQITIEGFKKYETAIKNGIGLIQKKYYLGYCEDTSFTYITKDDMSDVTLVAKPNQIYTIGGANSIKLFTDNVNDTNVKYSTYFSGGSNLSYSSTTLIDKVRFFVTNAPKGSFTINDEYGYQIYYLDENGNDVTNAVDKDEIIFEHFYNKNTDESHKLYVTNNSEYDMYINLECVLPTSSGDNVIYQYGENQLVSVAPFYYYHHLAYKSEEIAAKWLSYFLYDNATAELTEEEIYQNLLSSSDKWHKADYYSSGTCTIAYQYGLALTLSECMTSDRVSEITKLENIISERNYAIEDSSKNINQKNIYIFLAANDTKEINVLKNQLTLTSGVKYDWVLKIGSAEDKMGEHSRKGFTAISNSVGKDETDNNVYDENGNIIGSYDGDNNIIVDEEIKSDIDIDVSPDINTSSVKGFIQSVSEVIKMFWGILPPAVMSVVVFGLSIVLAVGVIRVVTG